MNTLHWIIYVLILIPQALTQFDCVATSKKDSTTSCNTQLSCYFEGEFEDPNSEYHRQQFTDCRCRTIIHELSLPNNILTYDLFNKICYDNKFRLKELWVVDAELEYIDNTIFEKYTNLRYLKLRGNNIFLNFSTQPEALTTLDISSNKLNVIEPDSLKNLKSLRMVNISFNQLDKVNYCFQELKLLEEIYLNNNFITKIVDKEFDHLQNLRILNLAHNLLTTIDSHLFLQNLQELHLNNNELTSINRPELLKLPKLKKLWVGNNQLTRFGNNYDFKNLEELHSENNRIREINKNVVGNLPKLRLLNLTQNSIENVGADTFSATNMLQCVDMSSNQLSNIDKNNFESFKHVLNLNLNNNSLSEKVINCENLQYLKNVNVLNLSHNQISVIFNCTFNRLQNLSKLSLLANQLERIPPGAFDALNKLQQLNLASNRLKDLPDGLFDNLVELRKLDISHNNLTKFNLNSLNNNPKITDLDIKSNQLKELDLGELKNKLPYIKSIDMDKNLVKCEEFNDVLEYFDENSIIFKSCPSKTACCATSGYSGKMVAVIVSSVAICSLAVIGLFTLICKLCVLKRGPHIQVLPMLHQSH